MLAIAFTPGCEGEAEVDPCAVRCEQNALVTCDTEGVVIKTECGDQRCASDSPVAQCVPALALPCDPDDPPASRCENGRVVQCAPTAGYILAQACPAGAICAEDSTACRPAADVGCDRRVWSVLCINGERFECNGRGEVVVSAASCAEAG